MTSSSLGFPADITDRGQVVGPIPDQGRLLAWKIGAHIRGDPGANPGARPVGALQLRHLSLMMWKVHRYLPASLVKHA